MNSAARPIVLAPAKVDLPGVAPENDELGVMLPYTPLHHLLFAAGAPEILVMTSANRSSEPIAYRDEDALRTTLRHCRRFSDRRTADRAPRGRFRCSRGRFRPNHSSPRARICSRAPSLRFRPSRPILALGADLKNTITLVVDGQAFVSQHIGDLDHYESFCAFRETIQDLLSMYEIDSSELLVVHDAHPQYVSTMHASELRRIGKLRGAASSRSHRFRTRRTWRMGQARASASASTVPATAMTARSGAARFSPAACAKVSSASRISAVLRLPGGDAAASHPVQAAAGFLAQLNELPDLTAAPFSFPSRYLDALQLVHTRVRSFARLRWGGSLTRRQRCWASRARLLSKDRPRCGLNVLPVVRLRSTHILFPSLGDELDFRPLLEGMIRDRLRGRDTAKLRARSSAELLRVSVTPLQLLCRAHRVDTVVLSGGVFFFVLCRIRR